jgi:hypothetical protein
MPLPAITVDGHQRVEEAVRGYLDAAAPSQFGLGPPAGDAHLRRLLLQVDAEVLRLYGLPPLLERQLLDTFAGSRRPGVPFVFERYYPEDFEPCIPLHEYLSHEYPRSAASESRKQHRAGAPGDSVADEAAQFMAAKGLGRAYDRFRALVGNAFPSLLSLATTLEIDPDAPHLRAIRLHAVVPGTLDEALSSKDAFDEALAKEHDRRLSFFVLTMEVVE